MKGLPISGPIQKCVVRCGAILLIALVAATSQAQTSKRCIVVSDLTRTAVIQDSLVIDAQSIVVTPAVPFAYDESRQTLIFSTVQTDSLEVCYRVIALPQRATFAHKSSSLYDSTAAFSARPTINNYAYQKDELFATPDIYKTGSLSRGVTFGNAQNLNVNSVFNFQMDGKLAENLNIRADITDQNVPYQPEGNTLQLREFDNVLFEIYNDNLSLKAGDVVLKNSDSHFLRFYKNVQGGQFDITYQPGRNLSARSTLSVAAAKGQFADVTITAIEGLQGPYPLPGPQGQRFVVVMANSEKVYVDGQVMTRGYNHDYIIDYNLGEISFNPTVVITQFTRIRITYEYADQNYSRSIIQVGQEITTPKSTFSLSYYQEKDNENKPLAFQLSDQDKVQMSLAGEDRLPVAISGETRSDYTANLVLYEKRDTVDLDGTPHTVYVHSRDSTQMLYRVLFSNVTAGQGAYQLVINDVNGRVYEWISPVGGINQGNFEAVRFVPAPNARQMIAMGVETRLSEHVKAFGELAFSDQDLNLFADAGNEDNRDMAYKVGVKVDKVPLRILPQSNLSATVDFERNGADFKPIDRFRSIEYDRNWSYTPQTDTFRTANHIFNTEMELHRDDMNRAMARFSIRKKENAIDGFQQETELRKSLGYWKWSGQHFFMKNENLEEKTDWRQWQSELYMDKFFVVPGYKIQEDMNEIRSAASDSLTRTVMNYTAHQLYLRNNDSLPVNFRVEYTLRDDRRIAAGHMVPYTRSRTTTTQASAYVAKNNRLDLTFTYRELDYKGIFDDLSDERTILGRVNWQGALLDEHIRTDLSYATSSSRELLREYIYIQVTSGEGTHTWRDLNEDGTQDLTEFFEAINFDEKNYIRVFVPTTDFVNAFNTLFVFSINSQMPKRWKSEGGLKELLSKISNRSSVNINKKNTNNDFDSRFNPFSLDISNEALIYVRDALRTVFFYNRSGRGLAGDVGYLLSHSKQLIARGIESRAQREFTVNLRFHLNQSFTLTSGFKSIQKENASQFQENRNYLIEASEVLPGMVWQPSGNVRFSTSYRLAYKQNVQASDARERSTLHAVVFESRWSNGAKNALNAKLSITDIALEGATNTAAAYELLEALQPGTNYVWQINYNQKLVSGLQINLGYDGRKSADRAVIHMGRMQLTALF